MVVLSVVIVVALCLGIGAGTLVLADGRLDAAAASGARAASQQSSPAQARAAARDSIEVLLADTGTRCNPQVDVDVDQFRPGGHVEVHVSCRIDLSPVAIAGFPAHRDLQASASAPLEHHRSFQAGR